MSSPVVERLFIATNPNITEIVRSLYETLAAVQGFQGMFWGANVESPSKTEILIIWNSDDALLSAEHLKVGAISREGGWKSQRLQFSPSSTLFAAPIVELLTLFSLPLSFTPASVNDLLSFIRGTPGCIEVVGVSPFTDREDIERAFLVIVGWESLEANELGAKSNGFQKLPKVEGAKVEMHHVRFQKVE